MTFEQYSEVTLLTNKYQEEGVSKGAVGYIIEVYNENAYEVEFSNSDGITIAQIVVSADEIQVNSADV